MTALTGDPNAAIDFLRRWRPEGPWVLTAINPEQRGIESETFAVTQVDTLLGWLRGHLGKNNIYFTVNPLLRSMSGVGAKAKKTDVKSLAWLHVDVDPRPGEEIASERERAVRILRNFSPPPTVIIDSGGGYQGFWKLDAEQPINGDENRAVELEAYNVQLEVLLGADTCHNVDRIMRLPGTINIPNEKKRKKGRVPALASVVEFHDERVYSLTAFTASPRVQTRETLSSNGPTVKISGNLPRLGSLDELPDAVTPRTRMLIVQGDDPDDPTKYKSRSEATFAVACEMVRAGCSDDQIASVLLDPDFGISAHCRAQGRPQDYAARQIRRAREEAINPWLRKLNEQHAVVEDVGGKCRVVSEVFDDALKRSRLSLQHFDDFRNRYMHIQIELGKDSDGEVIRVPLGKFWLLNTSRRQYRTIVFAPGREVTDSYNLWRGFACEARPGSCELFLKHVLDNICLGNQSHYGYLLGWMSRAVQHPDSPGEVAVVLRGRMGTGKGKFAKVFGSLWGRHFLHVSDPKHLVGSFNAHLRDCVVLFGDEAFFAGDKRHESMLKTLVTEETHIIEAKGVDAVPAANYVHLLLSSNSDWVVPAGADDRRFFVLDVSDAKAVDTNYFAAIDKEMEEGGREALLHFLMTYDLKGYEVRTVPKTHALQEQKVLSMGPVEEWWFEKLSDGRLGKEDSWPEEVSKDDLNHDMIRYMERQKIMRRPSPSALGKFLVKVMKEGYPVAFQKMAEISVEDGYGQMRARTGRFYFYKIPSLTECRDHFDKKFGGPYKWLEVVETEKTSNEVPF